MEPDVLFTNHRLQAELQKLREENVRLMKEIDGYKKQVDCLFGELAAVYRRIEDLEN